MKNTILGLKELSTIKKFWSKTLFWQNGFRTTGAQRGSFNVELYVRYLEAIK
jgi:hypothetical protein